jgi:murein DD-endopeptidase MepM/ murein hydrolase activator NlpD
MVYFKSQVKKPAYHSLSPDLQYKIWEKQNNKGSFARFCNKLSWQITIAVCLPGVAFIGLKPVNDFVTTSYQVASFFQNITRTPGDVSVTLQSLDDEQKQVTADIIAVGRSKGATDKDIKVALITAQQESGLKNVDHGDDWFFQQNSTALGSSVSDSAGVFQIRRINVSNDCQKSVKCSAEWFYDNLLEINPETRRNSEPWELAAKVQRPAKEYERHYEQWNKLADSILNNATGNKQSFNFLATLPINLPGGEVYQPPVNDPITSRFGMRIHPIKGTKKMHDGTDYGSATGTVIKTVGNGIVKVSENANDGYGNKIIIEHPNGDQSLYAHLDKSLVMVGDRVYTGSGIGLVGSTGDSTGSHLHLGFYRNGQAIDFESMLKK